MVSKWYTILVIIILTAAATKVCMCIVHNNKICKHEYHIKLKIIYPKNQVILFLSISGALLLGVI